MNTVALKRRVLHVAVPCLVGFASSASSAIDDDDAHWPQWRGPRQDGVSSAEGLPTEWGPDKNIIWKTKLPSWSGATPIIWGDRIFVTGKLWPKLFEIEVIE